MPTSTAMRPTAKVTLPHQSSLASWRLTVWAYLKLKNTGKRQEAKLDWWGNVTFAVGLIAVLVGITYGIQPYGGHTMGWTSPFVLTSIIGGLIVLAAFVAIERRVDDPMFH